VRLGRYLENYFTSLTEGTVGGKPLTEGIECKHESLRDFWHRALKSFSQAAVAFQQNPALSHYGQLSVVAEPSIRPSIRVYKLPGCCDTFRITRNVLSFNESRLTIHLRISKGTYGILAQEEPICCHVCCGYIQAPINA
jgi:hypothetical protein